MKTIKVIAFAFALIAISFSAYAQRSPQLYVIVQYADNSTSYNANFHRIENEIVNKYSSNNKIVFVSFNVTSDEISSRI